ncbi:MAG: tail fiber domain-containing protein [Candidatus Woesebacteria bacterium]|jgi:hypothetical protein
MQMTAGSEVLLTLNENNTQDYVRIGDGGDVDTTIYADSSYTAIFVEGSTGYVGIGTTAPARPLDINGAMRLETVSTPSSPAAGDIYSDGTNLYYYNGSSWEDLTTAAGGVVSSVSNVDGSLTISPTSGDVIASLNVANANTWTGQQTFDNTNTDFAQYLRHSGDTDTYLNFTDDDIKMATGDEVLFTLHEDDTQDYVQIGDGGDVDTTVYADSNYTAIFVEGSTGYVGIGTTAPARVLDINGAVRLETASTPSSPAAGDIYSDGTNLYYYNGSSWEDLTAGSGSIVNSVTNVDGTLTISPTTGDVVASINLANDNTWTGQQTFDNTNTDFAQYLRHSGDTDTYLNFTDDDLKMATGDEVLFTLHEDDTQDYVQIGDGGDVDTTVYADSNYTAIFVEGSSGNVGIGTTGTSTAKLQVAGAIVPTTTDYDLGTSSLRWDLYANTIDADSTVTLTGLGAGTDDTVLILNSSNQVTTDEIDSKVWDGNLVDGSGTANYITKWSDSDSLTDSVIYDDGTNIGIGTSDPGELLSINGRVQLAQTSSPTPTTDRLYNVSGNLFWNGTQLNGDGGLLPVGSGGETLYHDGASWINTDSLYNDASNVGIGTTDPGSKLQVAGAITPSVTDYDLGTSSLRWDLYANTIDADSTITLTGLGAGTDDTVLILNSSNQVTTDEIDSKVWDGSLVDGSGTQNYITKWSDADSLTTSIMYDDGTNVGIGVSSPLAKLDIAGTITDALRLRGADASAEIADIYVGTSGNLIISTEAGTDSIGAIDLRSEDDEFGLILRESDGTDSVPYANFYVADDTDPYMSINVNSITDGDALVITEGNNIGIGTAAPVYKLQVAGTIAPTVADYDLGTSSLRWEIYADTINADNTVTLTGLGTGTDNTVLILNSSNQVTTDEIDSRVWGSSLVDGSGTANYITKWSDANSLTTSVMFENGTNIGIGTTNAANKLSVISTGNPSTFHIGQSDNEGAFFTSIADSYLDVAAGVEYDSGYSARSTEASMIRQFLGVISFYTDDSLTDGSLYVPSERMRIDVDGNVGIGTTDPQYELDVNGITNVENYLRIGQGSGNTGDYMIRMEDSLGYLTNNITVNDGQGNFNIMLNVDEEGKIIKSSAGVSKILFTGHSADGEISLNAGVEGTAGDNGIFNIGLSLNSADQYMRIGNPNDAIGLDSAAGNIIADVDGNLYTTQYLYHTGDTNTYLNFPANDTIALDTAGSERMRITSNGNVGIGTTDPGRALHVVRSGGGLNAVQLRLETTGSNYWDIGRDQNTGDFKIIENDLGPTMVIEQAEGNVGIGTTGPDTPLHVVRLDADTASLQTVLTIDRRTTGSPQNGIGGAIEFRNERFTDSFYTGGKIGVILRQGAGGSADYHDMVFWTRDDNDYLEKVRIKSDGNVGINDTTPTYKLDVNGTIRGYGITDSSDIRFKKDIVPLGSSLSKILKLEAKKYYWINEKYGTEQQVGFIAQEMETVIPELVSTDDEGYKSIRYGKITAYLVEGIKEQQAQINALAESIATDINFDSSGELIIQQNQAGNYQVTQISDGSLITKIAAFAETVVGKVKAGLVETQELVAERITATKANISELSTKIIRIKNEPGKIATIEYKNSDNETIATLDSEGNAEFTGQTTLGQLITQNASVSGQLTAAEIAAQQIKTQQLETENATVSGQLIADNIQAHSTRLEYLESKMAELESIETQTINIVQDATVSGTLYAENIDGFEDKVAAAFRQPSLLGQLMGETETGSAEEAAAAVEDAGYSPPESSIPDATSIRQSLADLNLDTDDVVITPSAAYIDKYLEINGNAYVANTLGVNQTIALGDGMIFTPGSINYQPQAADAEIILRIQPSGLGQISLLAGLMVLDESGQIVIDGDLTVTGKLASNSLEANKIEAKQTLLSNLIEAANYEEPVQIKIAGVATDSGEVKQTELQIVNEQGIPVASISAEGKADFSGGVGVDSEDLSTNDSTTVIAQKTSGKAKVKAGETQITIYSELVTEDSLIYVTPVGSTNNQVLYVKAQLAENPSTPAAEGKFIVGFDLVTSEDVEFNWWIIN